MGIFKAYDIRGVFGREIDADVAFRVGRAFAAVSSGATVLVGYDARIHSAELSRELVRGLVEGGRKVVGAGMTSTPALHFAQICRGEDAAVMVTASHNPAEYHGFKFFDAEGGTMSYRKGLDRIEEAYRRTADAPLPPVTGGSCRDEQIHEPYLGFLADFAAGERFQQKIVVDASNGSAGGIFREMASRLNLDAEIVNAEPDGSFPAHPPNPLDTESRRVMAREVRDRRADLGALLDGDGDRIIFVDEGGEILEGYLSSALMAEEILRKHPGAAVVHDLISSRALPERITELGGRPVISRVGYTFVYDQMVGSDAVFASETSGHFYFRVDHGKPTAAADSERRAPFYTESAAYALVVMLRFLSRRGRSLSSLVGPLRRRYSQAPERNLRVARKDAALDAVESRFARGEISRLDGLSVSFPDFWFNLRPSNTEPLLRLRVEAVDAETAERRSGEIVELIGSEVGYED